MPRPQRYLPQPGTPVEITTRCLQGRYLLRPSRKMNRRIVGALAHFAEMYDVKVHSANPMSNHYGLMITPPLARAMADFMKGVNQAISVEVTHLHDWPGPMWARRYNALPILDEASQMARLKYHSSNGVKEGAVAKCRQWPGVNSIKALCEGRELPGEWMDWTAYRKAKARAKPGETVNESDFVHDKPLKLHPLPCLVDKSEAERRAIYARIADEVDAEALAERKRTGRPVMGARRVLEMNPHHRPKSMDRSPSPVCHASTRAARAQWLEAYRAFVEGYRRAVAALRQGIEACAFPEGGIMPLGAVVAPP